MKDIKEFYILGLQIDTEIGQCNFLKVKDYPDFYEHLGIIALTKQHLINNYREQSQEFAEVIEKYSLYEIVSSIQYLAHFYAELFFKVFGSEEALTKITKDNFDYYRSLIMSMNCVKEEKINPNPEIQKWIEKSKKFKQGEEKLDFADIASSVVGFNGLSYQDINEMTIYQLYMTFQRIAHIKGYDTSTLFATVAEKVDIQNWAGHIDLFKEEKHGISREEFDKKTSGVMKK